MRHKSLALIGLALGGLSSVAPAFANYDDFALPPNVEQTQIPRRARYGATGKSVDPADLAQIEHLRGSIQRLYAQSDYVNAEPLYKQYVQLIEKVSPDDSRLAAALQNYADLLRRVNKDEEANAVETRAAAILAQVQAEVQPYGLKQYRLGMSLDEFAQLPPPGNASKVATVCSCDAGQTVEVLSDEDKMANAVQCGFWSKQAKDGGVGMPQKMTVANIECRPDFKFIEEQKSGYRLFEISLTFFSSNFDVMKEALIGRYGKPKETHVEKMRTEMGNIFLLTNLIWDNGVSKIRLTNADGENLGTAKLRFIHRQLYLAYAKRVNAQKDLPFKRAEEDL